MEGIRWIERDEVINVQGKGENNRKFGQLIKKVKVLQYGIRVSFFKGIKWVDVPTVDATASTFEDR